MNKKQRFMAAVTGETVDRPPVTAWVHFQSDHLDAARVADLHHQFLKAYDWDVLKVMNDYRYPVPAGIRSLDEKENLAAYKRLDMSEPCFATQLECLKQLRQLLGEDVPVLETVFEPYQQILRNIGFSESINFFGHRTEALEAIDIVTETTCEYV